MSAQIQIYAGGHILKSPFAQASAEYLKQLRHWRVTVTEISHQKWEKMTPKPEEYWVVLAETGKVWDSPGFATALDRWTQNKHTLCFLIGEFQGLPDHIRRQGHEQLSLGAMTWPHLLARVLLLEQVYRAQQRRQGHPYSFV